MIVNGEVERIPVAQDYALALGRACYIFAYLEACVIRCIEMFEPGYQASIRQRKMTAGQIAFDFVKLAERGPVPEEVAARIVAAAAQFDVLVDMRNDLLHGRPRMAPGGEQRLYRLAPDGHEVDWTLDEIQEAANAFEFCAMEVTAILNLCIQHLSSNAPPHGQDARKTIHK
jgi:hypothetical protein